MFVLILKVLFFSALSYILGRIKGLLLLLFFFLVLFCSLFFFVGVKFALHFLRPRGVVLSRLRTKISLIRYKAVAFKFI